MTKTIMLVAKILIITAICLLQNIVSNAEAENQNLLSASEQGFVWDICESENGFYVLTDLGIYNWGADNNPPKRILDLSIFQRGGISASEPKNSAERSIWERYIGRIFTLNGQLIGLHPFTGQLWSISSLGLEPLATLPQKEYFTSEDEGDKPKELINIVSSEDKILVVLQSFTFEHGNKVELYQWKLGDAEMQLLASPMWDGVWNGLDDMLIVRSSTDRKIYLYDTKAQTVVRTLWVEKDNETTGGYVWDSHTEMLLFVGEGGSIQAVSGQGKVSIKAYLPVDRGDGTNRGWLISNRRYMYLHNGNIYVRSLSEGKELHLAKLQIVGMPDARIVAKYAAVRPNVSLSVVEAPTDFLSVQQAMVSRDDSTDIYILNSNRSYGHVLRKGYAAPLSNSKTLVSKVSMFYPAIKDVLFFENELYGYPVSILPQNWTINETKWIEFGLGASYPSTVQNLIDVMKQWNDDYADEHPDYKLFDTAGGFRGIVSFVVQQYLLENYEEGEMISFDTEDFRAVLSILVKNRELFSHNEEERVPIIMNYYQYYGGGYNDSDRVISVIPPRISDNSRQRVNATLEVFVVNPLSARLKEAMEFIEYYATNVNTVDRYLLSPANNTPVRPSGFERLQAITLEKITYLQKSLQTSSDSDRSNIESLILSEQRDYDYRNAFVWEVTQADIDRYQNIAHSLSIPLNTVFANDATRTVDQAIYQIIYQFADGAIPIDMFIEALNGKARLLFLEGIQ